MAERPILLFPERDKASRSRLWGGGGDLSKPTHQRQQERLSQKFRQLQDALEAKRIEIQQSNINIPIEQVLVIETIRSVDDFAKAVKRIDGLEWMGEIEIDEIEPNEDFRNKENPKKNLTRRLYMAMTNQQALEQILSLWKQYGDDPEKKFEGGLDKFRRIFEQLNDIRRWGVRERLEEAGALASWKESLKHDGDRKIIFEAELWFRGSAELQSAITKRVTELVQKENGHILDKSTINGIAYHGLLGELPAKSIRLIVESQDTNLVKCEDIMLFRPIGQMAIGEKLPEGEEEISKFEDDMPKPEGDPIVAILDGMPLANHKYLKDRLIVDDPDNLGSQYRVPEMVHGTAMASLIIRGDLNQHQPPLPTPVYIRPIMRPLDSSGVPRQEGIPEYRLAVDLIHSAVKRICEGDIPSTHQVRIINLSIGVYAYQFMHSMSPFARLLDWLSAEHRVLFVVSAGNHTNSISLEISQEKFDPSQINDLESLTIGAIYRDAKNRKLLSPAETINGLTIGSIHFDESEITNMGDRIDPFKKLLPSPISAFGGGYRHAIKPDMVFHGGKQFYRSSLSTKKPVALEPAISYAPPGNKVASPGKIPGELGATSHNCGTSNAAALISRIACFCYDSLQHTFSEQAAHVNTRNYEVPLLKAMLVHSCSWGDIGSHLKDTIEKSDLGEEIRKRAESLYKKRGAPGGINRQYRNLLSNWIGYGIPQIDRSLGCTAHRATLLGYGELSDGNAHIFHLPLPPSLSGQPERRRLTVTLAWLSPISISTQKYRTASLWFEITNDHLTINRRDVDWQTAKRGTVQHEILEGQRADPLSNGDIIEIKVNCRKDAGEIRDPIAYGLMVSLEVSEGIDIDIYDEIRARVAPIPIHPTADEG